MGTVGSRKVDTAVDPHRYRQVLLVRNGLSFSSYMHHISLARSGWHLSDRLHKPLKFTDPPLTRVGCHQARAVGAALAQAYSVYAPVIFCSNIQVAKQTAYAIVAAVATETGELASVMPLPFCTPPERRARALSSDRSNEWEEGGCIEDCAKFTQRIMPQVLKITGDDRIPLIVLTADFIQSMCNIRERPTPCQPLMIIYDVHLHTFDHARHTSLLPTEQSTRRDQVVDESLDTEIIEACNLIPHAISSGIEFHYTSFQSDVTERHCLL